MATLLQRIGAVFGLGESEPLVSTNTVASGTENAAFHLDIHDSGPVGQQILIASTADATLVAENDQRALMVGNSGDDVLDGGDQTDLLIGGRGTNLLSGGGGTDTFGHAAGARDIITDFSADAGERIALADGLSLTGSSQGRVDPATYGFSGNAVEATTLTFNDGSQVVLLQTQDTPQPEWFI